jgi:hypothetical protein
VLGRDPDEVGAFATRKKRLARGREIETSYGGFDHPLDQGFKGRCDLSVIK